MVIAALATFAALLVAWLLAPATERGALRPGAPRPAPAARPAELTPEAG